MEQVQRNGGRQSRPLVERFWTFVDKKGPVPQHRKRLGRCWVWVGGRTGSGRHKYGVISIGGQSRSGLLRAHRASWQIHRGPIPAGQCVLHRCDHPLCVRPSHLFLGTRLDNVCDMVAKGRAAFGRRGPNLRATIPPYPERFVWPRLEVDDVRDLLEWLDAGLTFEDAAEMFGISPAMVGHIAHGRRWGSVSAAAS